jgi:T-complex protein 1 subunit theta
MLKEGAQFFSGVEEAVLRNITACKEFSTTVSSAYGPNGMNKMVINHLDKLFVTNDAATIIRELEVEHPAAKMMILGSQMMEQEVGDGTNFVIVLAGALLAEAEELIHMGLKPTEIAEGYELALEKALTVLETLKCGEIKDSRDLAEVKKAIRSSVMSKQYGNEDFITELIAKACISILPEKSTFNVDNVRVTKILGSGLLQSSAVQGMVFKRGVATDIIKQDSCKIVVYTCPVDQVQTETKGTVLIKTAKELTDFSRGEEQLLEKQIKAIADTGVTVVVSGGKIGDMALHYLNKYNLMAVRLTSKWDIRRLCKSVGATPLPKMTTPTKEELGYADRVYVDELGDTSIVVFRLDSKESPVATVVVRGSTDNYMDDIERAIDDGVNTFKGICKDGRLVPGGGAVEMEISRQVSTYGETCPGMEQYAIQKFATALTAIPRLLAENTGANGREVLAALTAAHEQGNANAAFNLEGEDRNTSVIDATKAGIFDLMLVKYWGMKYAVNAACTILRVDQIIMAKRAGGPKPKPQGAMDAEDED